MESEKRKLMITRSVSLINGRLKLKTQRNNSKKSKEGAAVNGCGCAIRVRRIFARDG